MVEDFIRFDAVVAVIAEESVLEGLVPVFVAMIVVELVSVVPYFIMFDGVETESTAEFISDGLVPVFDGSVAIEFIDFVPKCIEFDSVISVSYSKFVFEGFVDEDTLKVFSLKPKLSVFDTLLAALVVSSFVNRLVLVFVDDFVA